MENDKTTKKDDEIYCPECGNPIKKNSIFCQYCGFRIKGQENTNIPSFNQNININQNTNIPQVINPKNKGVAIVLAIFLGFWTWLYTYRKDSLKFWISLAVALVLGSIIGYFTFGIGSIIIGIGLTIWAIIDTAVKPESFYNNYPFG
jgi:DNA-directed RNA polymerase subunit RPC12/RpoP